MSILTGANSAYQDKIESLAHKAGTLGYIMANIGDISVTEYMQLLAVKDQAGRSTALKNIRNGKLEPKILNKIAKLDSSQFKICIDFIYMTQAFQKDIQHLPKDIKKINSANALSKAMQTVTDNIEQRVNIINTSLARALQIELKAVLREPIIIETMVSFAEDMKLLLAPPTQETKMNNPALAVISCKELKSKTGSLYNPRYRDEVAMYKGALERLEGALDFIAAHLIQNEKYIVLQNEILQAVRSSIKWEDFTKKVVDKVASVFYSGGNARVMPKEVIDELKLVLEDKNLRKQFNDIRIEEGRKLGVVAETPFITMMIQKCCAILKKAFHLEHKTKKQNQWMFKMKQSIADNLRNMHSM